MAQLTNNFNATSGGTITQANSGGALGDSWDALSGSPLPAYSASNTLHGVRGALLSTTGTSTSLAWNGKWLGSPIAFTRTYFRVTALPTSNVTFLQIRTNAGGILGEIRLQTSGGLNIRIPQTLHPLGNATAIVQPDEWYRLETRWQHLTSTTLSGFYRLYYGSNIEGSVPDYTFGDVSNGINVSGVDGVDGLIGQLSQGISGSGLTMNMSLDSVGINDVDWFGSISPPPGPPPGPARWGALNAFGSLSIAGFGLSSFGIAPFGE